MNELCYLIDIDWLLENIFTMLANDDEDVSQQMLEYYLDTDSTGIWFEIVAVREIELNLDSYGCLDADL